MVSQVMEKKKLPLQGLRVVELATAVAAPVTARLLATYGADVVKIETPPYGDILRPMAAGQMEKSPMEENPVFDTFNTGKRLIALNLKAPEGKKIAEQLLFAADVFVTNVRMRSLVKLGLDYETLCKAFPKLIYAHFSGFGLNGPDADAPGFDITGFWMRSGAATDTVEPDTHPLSPSFGFGDIVSASNFLSGILMALIAREKSGTGTLVTTSLLSSGMWCNTSYIIETQGDCGKTFPASHYETWDPFSFQYKCADGKWIAVMEKNYSRDREIFAHLFSMPELITDPDLVGLREMSASGKGPAVIRRVEEVMLTRTAAEWKVLLDENDVANMIAQHYSDVPQDAQARANKYLTDMRYGSDTFAIPEPPVAFSEYGRVPFAKTSPIGGDSNEVLAKLGYRDTEISELKEKRAVL